MYVYVYARVYNHKHMHTYIQMHVCISMCMHGHIPTCIIYIQGFCGGSDGKESAYKAGDRVWSLGQEDPLEMGMATHSCIPAWRIPGTEEHGGLQPVGLQTVEHSRVTGTLLALIHTCPGSSS